MPKGQVTVIEPFKDGPLTQTAKINGMIEGINDHDKRLNALEGLPPETRLTLVVINGVPHYAEVPMRVKSEITQ